MNETNSEILFTYDTSLEKFRSHINQYRDKDLERFLETLYIYIETLSCQEMNERIHKAKVIAYTGKPVFETEMDGVVKLATVLDKFLKKSGQIH